MRPDRLCFIPMLSDPKAQEFLHAERDLPLPIKTGSAGDIHKDLGFTAMDDTADTAQVIIRPPLGWGFAVIVGLALNWFVPLPFLPVDLPAGSLGASG